MASALYLLGVTVLLLVALAVAIPVLGNIIREGLENRGTWRTFPEEREATTNTNPGHCSHCGTQNGPEFTYCQQCSRRL